MKRAIGELREQREKFRGKSERSTNHKSMEEACYKENLELRGPEQRLWADVKLGDAQRLRELGLGGLRGQDWARSRQG